MGKTLILLKKLISLFFKTPYAIAFKMILALLKIFSAFFLNSVSLNSVSLNSAVISPMTVANSSLLSLQEAFSSPLPQVGLGDTLMLFFQSVYFLRSLNLGYYGGIAMSFFLLLLLAFIIYLVYITFKTLFMKKEMLMMSSVMGEEGEVIEITDDYGKEGWILIYGENWRFKSKNLLKVGDTVKVTKNKKMNLLVEKIEASF